MKLDKIEIDKENVPYRMEIILGAELYTIGVNYNSKHDLFTLSLEKDDEVLCEGEPLIYGVPLWQDMMYRGGYPALRIIPLDLSGQENKVTFDNLGETVFLYVDNQEEELVSG